VGSCWIGRAAICAAVAEEVGTVMAASGQTTSGYWAALLIGVLLLLIFVATTTGDVVHAYRARRNETPHQRTDGLPDLPASGMGASLLRCQASSPRRSLSGSGCLGRSTPRRTGPA